MIVVSPIEKQIVLMICRICAQESTNGQTLFYSDIDLQRLATRICSYISIKLKYHRQYPNWICPGCHLQLESTSDFFTLIRNGQKILSKTIILEPKQRKVKEKQTDNDGEQLDQRTSQFSQTSDVTEEKRSSRLPLRLQDSVQGQELQKFCSEIGISRSTYRKPKATLIADITNDDGSILGKMLVLPKKPERSVTQYQCEVCKEKFCRDTSFANHVATHKNILYECIECEKRFETKSGLDSHQSAESHCGLGIIETPCTDPQQCVEDDVTNATVDTDETSEQSKSILKTTFCCSKCSKQFPSRTSMLRHHMTHSELRPFKCDLCPATFKQKSILQIHKSSHLGERSFKCHKCPKSFTHRHTLTAHLRSHDGLRPYLCPVCKKTFFQFGALQEHKRVHTGERPYACPTCNSSFKTSSQCRVHQRVHNSSREYIPRVYRNDGVQKTHACKTCNKIFSQKSTLVKHQRTHTGEKPFLCHICLKKFADPSNFNRHKRIHQIQTERNELYSEGPSLLKQTLTQISSNSDPDPDGPTSPLSTSTSDIFPLNDNIDDCYSGFVRSWEFPRESPEPIITEINNDAILQEVAGNQLVRISHQDPSDPLINRTTFYVAR